MNLILIVVLVSLGHELFTLKRLIGKDLVSPAISVLCARIC